MQCEDSQREDERRAVALNTDVVSNGTMRCQCLQSFGLVSGCKISGSKARQTMDITDKAMMAAAYRRFGKRALDLCLCAPLLLLTIPFLAVLGFIVRFGLGPPVIFVQTRAGLGGKSFTMLKFRSMTNQRDSNGILLSDDKRLTRLGKFLRATSLDELPELLNVVKGDMSLVGPRPLLPVYVHRHTPQQLPRYDVKPGITGWAQINGRNALDWERRFEMDVYYTQNCGFWLDMKILLLTMIRVVTRQGSSPSDGRATSPEFLGTEDINTAQENTARKNTAQESTAQKKAA
ncbi:MAG: sugar transferase [Pirellulales bacterium]